MQSFLKKGEILISFEIKAPVKIKVFDYHVSKPLIAYVTHNGIFSLWDYERKTCLKSFNCNALESKELTKPMIVKQIKFFDRDTLNTLFPFDQKHNTQEFEKVTTFKHYWIIIVSEVKIIFYDYFNEKIEVISPLILDNKIPRCIEIIDPQTIAIGCNDGIIKVFDIKIWNFTKILRGYHQKYISNLEAYKPNPLLKTMIIASSNDGLIGMWNPYTEQLVLKFGMIQKGKAIATANGGQEATSISIDRGLGQMITQSEAYITLWDLTTGNELCRYKSIKDSHKANIIGSYFLSCAGFSKGTTLAHAKGSEILVYDVTQGLDRQNLELEYSTFHDLKSIKDIEKDVRIYGIKVHYSKPHLIFLYSSQGVYTLTWNRMVMPNIFFHPTFSINANVSQLKPLIAEQGIIKKLTQEQKQDLQTIETDVGEKHSQTILTLSITNKMLICTAIDKKSLFENEYNPSILKTAFYKYDTVQKADESEIKMSASGKFFSIWFKNVGLYELYLVRNRNLMIGSAQNPFDPNENLKILDTLHPLGIPDKFFSGCASSIVWHNGNDEFAVLSPIGPDGNLIQIQGKVEVIKKQSLFGQSKTIEKIHQTSSGEIKRLAFLIYQLVLDPITYNVQINLLYKNDKLESPSQLFGGPYYAITEKLFDNDINDLLVTENEILKKELKWNKTTKTTFYGIDGEPLQIMQIPKAKFLEPSEIYWSLNGTICIMCYQNLNIIYKCNPKTDQFAYFQHIDRQIIHGYFFENMFFYCTDSEIYLAIFDLNDIIDIKLASDIEEYDALIEMNIDDYFSLYDSIYPVVLKKKPGHLKILGITDFKLILGNIYDELSWIELSHPFLRFMMFLQFGRIDECLQEVKKMDNCLYNLLSDLFRAYDYAEQALILFTSLKNDSELMKYALKESFLNDRLEEKILKDVNFSNLTDDLIGGLLLEVKEKNINVAWPRVYSKFVQQKIIQPESLDCENWIEKLFF